MKKNIALLLAMLMLTLAACATEPPVATPDTPTTFATADEPTIETEPPTTTFANDRFDPDSSAAVIGKWSVSVTLDGSIFNLTDMEEVVEATMVYQLSADGTYYRGLRDYNAVITAYGEAVERFMLDRLYAKFSAEKLIEGVSKKKIDALWEETQKADAEEQAKRFVEGLYLDYRFSPLNTSGDYYEENGIIWFSLDDGSYEPCGYTVTEEGLTINEVENIKLYKQVGLECPLLLTKEQ